MTVDEAVGHLRRRGISSFELSGILVIPVSPSDVDRLDSIAKNVKRTLDEIGYDKSWCLNPYHKETPKEMEKEIEDNE